MRIAIIVPAYNVAPFLRDTLQSVINQTHRDWSLIVVDDGSTDATAAVANSFTDPRIHIVRQANAGVSAARNRGIRDAGYADSYLFLDGDDWLAPDALARLASALEDAPWAAAACGRYARIPADGGTHLSAAPPQGCLLERLLVRNLFANGGHLLIRREAVEAAGRFRDDLRYGEDWEYWARIALCGEFAAARGSTPMLFVRERTDGAYLSRAADPKAYAPAIDAMYRNPAMADRLGRSRLADLRRRAEAETAWCVGRELIRHGHRRDGTGWLARSIRGAPSVRRLALFSLSWSRFGPFRAYREAA